MPICTKCKEDKDSSGFAPNKRKRNGLMSYCKECDSKDHKDHHQKVRTYHLEQMQLYYQKNKPKIQEHHRRYGQENKLRIKEYNHLFYLKNKDKVRKYVTQWALDNPEKYHAMQRAAKRKRRVIKLGVPGSHTAKDFLELCEGSGWKCEYCGCDLTSITATEDHIIPISRTELSPTDDIDNIVPACLSCNSSKHNRTPEEWFEQIRISEIPQSTQTNVVNPTCPSLEPVTTLHQNSCTT